MKITCSKCGKNIESIVIKVTAHYEILKNTDAGLLSEYNNVSEATSEILCEECFDKYCDCMESLNDCCCNLDFTEIVDDVQYGV